jgi:dUTP pyrophosphatase
MKRKVLKFQILENSAKIPQFAHDDDAGFDIFSNEKVTIKKGSIYGVSTGISSEIPKGYFVSIRDKSGLAIKDGIHVMGGVIDAGYRGEWKVILVNLGKKAFKVEKGNKIAQGILEELVKVKIIETTVLKSSKRGKGGFGSTGK